MGQILHGSATTTHIIRAAIQRSKAPLKGAFVNDAPMGPKTPRSTVLLPEEEAIVIAFRKHTAAAARRLPLCPAGDRPTLDPVVLASLPQASWHQPAAGGRRRQALEEAFQTLPDGYFHIDIAEVRTNEGKLYLFVAIDRTSKFTFAELHPTANVRTAANFLTALIKTVPYRVHTVLTDNGIQLTVDDKLVRARPRHADHDLAAALTLCQHEVTMICLARQQFCLAGPTGPAFTRTRRIMALCPDGLKNCHAGRNIDNLARTSKFYSERLVIALVSFSIAESLEMHGRR